MKETETAVLIAEKAASLGGTVYYVGGMVRDRLMGLDVKDVDIEVHGITSVQLENILDSIGERIEIGKSFGIYNLRGLGLDIALPRTERAFGNGHRDFSVTADPFMGTREASRRRDFTVNAMLENVLTGEITDCFGGQSDLEKKILRHIDDNTFSEDPLRVLRAAQFSARLGFEIAAETLSLCRNIDISTLSCERIMLETEKALLKSEKPSVYFEQLRRMGQLDVWFPEVKRLAGVPQNQEFHREGDVWTHTMLVLDEAAKRRDKTEYPLGFMLSALCHDFGKPSVTEEINGVYHAYGHEEAGIPEAERFLSRITSETKLIKYVLNMTKLHMQPNIMAGARSRMKKTNKLFDTAVSPYDLIQLAVCDSLGKIPSENKTEEFLMQRYERFREVMSRPYVQGRDLINAGLKPSENFSVLLEYAHKLRLAGVDKENALRQTLSYKPEKNF